MNKVLIFYTSVGLGHKSVAENIGAYLEEAGYIVKLEDMLVVQSGRLVEVSKYIHAFINNYLPFVWSFLYKSELFTKFGLPLRTKIAAKHFENTKLVIDGFNPDLIITTQVTASAVVSYLKQKSLYEGKFGIAFSDYHLHRFWLFEEADFYLANTAEQKQQMISLGFSENRIFVCGMPLKKKLDVNVSEVKQKLGIQSEDKIILFSSGSLGTGLNIDLIQNTMQTRRDVHAIVVTGKNKDAYQKLENIFKDQKVTVLGYYSPMEELYAISDLCVGKPGGLSVAEAVRVGLPVLVSHMLPGQEELNFEYLEDKGLVMPEAINFQSEIDEEIETHAFKNALLGNPAVKQLLPGSGPVLEAIRSVL